MVLSRYPPLDDDDNGETMLLVGSIWERVELTEDGDAAREEVPPQVRPRCRRLHRCSAWALAGAIGLAFLGATLSAAVGSTTSSPPTAALSVRPGALELLRSAADEEALRKAQGLCLELPGVRLASVAGETLGEVAAASEDACIQHCRKLVGCKQVVSEPKKCIVFSSSTTSVIDVHKGYRSAYCGVLTDMRKMNSKKTQILGDVEARKSKGVCMELPGLLLGTAGEPIKDVMQDDASKCFEECRKLPYCKQATFTASKGTCTLSESLTKRVSRIGDDFRSSYCGKVDDRSDLKERKEDVQTELRMRKAQSICLDLLGVRLASDDSWAAPDCTTWAHCSDGCRVTPGCAQAVFSEKTGKCMYSANSSSEVRIVGEEFVSAFCGRLEETMDMKLVQDAVMKGVKARKSKGVCVEVEGVAIEGSLELQTLDLHPAAECFRRCQSLPDCQLAITTDAEEQSQSGCRLYSEASATVAHLGEAHSSALCGTTVQAPKLKKLKSQVQRELQTRRSMGICEELPGVQLADGGGPGSLAAFPHGVHPTAQGCVERCRREPGCAQAIYSKGNGGCYLFREASTRAVHANSIYHSALCSEAANAQRMKDTRQQILEQVQMRSATGICKELPGVQIADGSGFHEALFSNETKTPHKCIEACRARLGCEQVVFSAGNRGCYMFENASDIRAVQEGEIFHSAYCADLEHVGDASAKKTKVEKYITERKTHGLCFEVPEVRAKDGVVKLPAAFRGNVTRERCVGKCKTTLGCEEAIFAVKQAQCYLFGKASAEIFPGMWPDGSYNSAFCGSQQNWKVHKAQQQKVQGAAEDRRRSGACIDLPGVQLVVPKGTNFYTWAHNATDCVEHCRAKAYCGQVHYSHRDGCHLFQNMTVGIAALGKAYHSARCVPWSKPAWAELKRLQKTTLELLKRAPKN